MTEIKLITDPQDFALIQDFFATIGRDLNITQSLLTNEYHLNPDKYGFFLCAYANHEVIGTLGNIGFDLYQNGHSVNSLMLDRVLINRAYWGKDVFHHLMQASYARIDTLTEQGFFWGLTPVPKSFVRIGFKVFDCVISSVLNLTTQNLHIPTDTNIALKNDYNLTIEECIKLQSSRNKNMIFLNYSLPKYHWFVSEPEAYQREITCFYRGDENLGFCIIRYTNTCIAIIDDIHFLHNEYIEPILLLIIQKLTNKRCKELRFIANKTNELLQKVFIVLEKLGGFSSRYPAQLIVKSFQENDLTPEKFYFTRLWSPPHWLPPRAQ